MRTCTVAHTFGLLAIVSWSALPLNADAHEAQPSAVHPMRLAIAGLVHGHVRGFLRALTGRTDVRARRHRRARRRRCSGSTSERYGLAAAVAIRDRRRRCSIARSPTRWPRSPARSITRGRRGRAPAGTSR